MHMSRVVNMNINRKKASDMYAVKWFFTEQIRNIWLIFFLHSLHLKKRPIFKWSPWSSYWIPFLNGTWKRRTHTHAQLETLEFQATDQPKIGINITKILLFWTCLHRIGGARTTHRQISRCDCSLPHSSDGDVRY